MYLVLLGDGKDKAGQELRVWKGGPWFSVRDSWETLAEVRYRVNVKKHKVWRERGRTF